MGWVDQDGFAFEPGFILPFGITQMKTDYFGPSGHDKVWFD